jgi:catalase
MDKKNPVKAVAEKAGEVIHDAALPAEGILGAPGVESPPVEEPTEPRGPLRPMPDQSGPETLSPTGKPTGADQADVAQQREHLTTAQGARLYDSDHSLKAGARGPVLLQDHHLREKIMHFDHERIPERVVHAPWCCRSWGFPGLRHRWADQQGGLPCQGCRDTRLCAFLDGPRVTRLL